MSTIKQTAVLGAGVIGSSWAALFSAAGYSVAIYDPAPDAEASTRKLIKSAWPTLEELGLVKGSTAGELSFHHSAVQAVEGAQFVQENVPERIDIKHALFSEIESSLGTNTVVASSASGLTLSEMQTGWKNPSRFVLGHPFNPPHLIPLVEVMGNERTADGTVELAEQFYRDVGKVTIRVQREMPGHVANRLQAAVWREAIHLVKEGVASVEDVDTAMWAGPGLRWAAMGPTMLFHLGAGDGGLATFCERYSDSFNRWWDDLGSLHLDDATAKLLVEGVIKESEDQPTVVLSEQRDALITAMQKATATIRR